MYIFGYNVYIMAEMYIFGYKVYIMAEMYIFGYNVYIMAEMYIFGYNGITYVFGLSPFDPLHCLPDNLDPLLNTISLQPNYKIPDYLQ